MMKKLGYLLLSLMMIANLFALENPWMRTDADATGFYLWFGGTGKCPFMDKPMAHDFIYYPTINALETEFGPVINFGSLDVVPMLGIWHNITSGETEYVMPEIYFYYTHGNIYTEIWNLLYSGTATTTKEQLFYYGRYFMKVSNVVDWMVFGPQVEITYDFDKNLDEPLVSLPIGGRFAIPYGEGNSFELFLGVETKNDNQFTSRVTFIRYF